MDEDWSSAYDDCYWFGELWRLTHTLGSDWPRGLQLDHGKMYQDGQLCLPTSVPARVMRAIHAAAGHPGREKLHSLMQPRYAVSPRSTASTLCRDIPLQCTICQAAKEPNFPIKTIVQSTPIPARLGGSMALDIFNLPGVVKMGERYDCMVVAVDRLSGWTIAVPSRRRGIQAQSVAEEMWERWWQPFGVPATVSSDQGPQFVGAWWRTLCASMGVRKAYSQAYHQSANGRGEVAGKMLM